MALIKTRYSAAREKDANGKWSVLRGGKSIKRFATREGAREAARALNADAVRRSVRR